MIFEDGRVGMSPNKKEYISIGKSNFKVKQLDKESIYLLQKIDCNCNDCKFMIRNMNRIPKKGVATPINYGLCNKFDKDISFIPAICQIDTQECFKHRKDEN